MLSHHHPRAHPGAYIYTRMDPFAFSTEHEGILAAEYALNVLRLFLHSTSTATPGGVRTAPGSSRAPPVRVGGFSWDDSMNLALRAQLDDLEDMLRMVTDARLARSLVEDQGERAAVGEGDDEGSVELLRFIVMAANGIVASQTYDSLDGVSDIDGDDETLHGGLPVAGSSSDPVVVGYARTSLPRQGNRDDREPPPSPLSQFSDILEDQFDAGPQVPQNPSCIVCTEELPSLTGRLETPCGHFYCPQCALNLVEEYISRSFPSGPLRCCPQPQPPIPPRYVRRFINDTLRRALDEKTTEAETPFERRIYCPQDTCRKFIDPAMVTPVELVIGSVICPNSRCRTSVCLRCKGLAHKGDCDRHADDAEATRIQRQFGWGRCPGCRFVVEKVDGCNRVSCTRCGRGFTYTPMARN